jgi:copper chaperone
MKKNYEIKGMGCGGCVSNVKRALLQLPDITEADVQLNPQSAVLTMSKPVDVEELQAELKKAGDYAIREALLN